jgi:hypothetical protein
MGKGNMVLRLVLKLSQSQRKSMVLQLLEAQATNINYSIVSFVSLLYVSLAVNVRIRVANCTVS